jgi:hypothetical protein
MRDRIAAARLMREMAERLDKVARATTDSALAAKLTRMAREVETHAAELETTAAADPSGPAGSGAGHRFPH